MKLRSLRLILVVMVLVILGIAVLPANAQLNEGVCSTRPTAQVRFYNFPDIPVYASEANADEASAIFAGEIIADQIPNPDVRIRGGNRQKYLLCGSFTPGDGSVRIILGNRLVWGPEYLIESIVPRNWTDSQTGMAGEWGS